MSIRVNVDWYLRSVQSQTLQIQHSNPILAWDVKTFLHHLRTNLNSYPSSLHSDLWLLVFQSISAPTGFSWESGPIVTIFVQIERGFAQLVMRSVATDVMTTPQSPGVRQPGPDIVVTITTFSWPGASDSQSQSRTRPEWPMRGQSWGQCRHSHVS